MQLIGSRLPPALLLERYDGPAAGDAQGCLDHCEPAILELDEPR